MKTQITIREWCELQLFMIANGYAPSAIRAEKDKYVFVNGPATAYEIRFGLNGDMANQFNESQEDPDCYDEQDPMGL